MNAWKTCGKFKENKNRCLEHHWTVTCYLRKFFLFIFELNWWRKVFSQWVSFYCLYLKNLLHSLKLNSYRKLWFRETHAPHDDQIIGQMIESVTDSKGFESSVLDRLSTRKYVFNTFLLRGRSKGKVNQVIGALWCPKHLSSTRRRNKSQNTR